MKNKQLNDKGFGLLGVLVIVLVVAGAGFSGWLVWHKNHDTKKTASTTNSTSNKDKNADNATADPYAGWKTYTDSVSHYSFKYPATWSVESDETSTTLRNSQKTAMATFAYKLVKDGGDTDFYVSSIDSVSALSGLKVVGGYLTDGNSPTYAVVDASQTTSLKTGEVGQFAIAPRYTAKDGESVQLVVYPTGTVFSTTDEAKAWFGSDAAKEALLVLQSLSYN